MGGSSWSHSAVSLSLGGGEAIIIDGFAGGIAFHAVETGIGLPFGVAGALWFLPMVRVRGRVTSTA